VARRRPVILRGCEEIESGGIAPSLPVILSRRSRGFLRRRTVEGSPADSALLVHRRGSFVVLRRKNPRLRRLRMTGCGAARSGFLHSLWACEGSFASSEAVKKSDVQAGPLLPKAA